MLTLHVIRGAAMASVIGIPKSRLLSRHWRTPVLICDPPGAPMTRSGAGQSAGSRGNTMVGLIDVNRRLPGARLPARPGRGSKTAMHPLNMKPRPSVMTPLGIPSECVHVTAPPFASTTLTCVDILYTQVLII